MDAVEDIEIVIVGGGLCGLATALALHKKGIKSVVLERSESLRATGAGIAVHTNGWRAYDQLGIGSELRKTALPLQVARTAWLDSGKQRETPISEGEARCVIRSELIEALAAHLPPGTVRLGCQIVSVKLDTVTSSPILQMHDGKEIKAEIVIGCDGANSVIADFLELKPPKLLSACALRGFTNYPNGHGLAPEFIRQIKGQALLGRAPVTDTLVFWFVVLQAYPEDSNVWKDPELIRQLALESVKGFPTEMIEMIDGSDLKSLSLTHMRYRAPWDVLFGKFRKGTVTVAGDAMHVMGPFLGQGGSAGVEDSIVLARCLAPTLLEVNLEKGDRGRMVQKVGEALDAYTKERRMRLVRLSTQTYLMGTLLIGSSPMVVKLGVIIAMVALFRDPIGHSRYDCGRL
ncbi:monooxygenase 1-like [Juglans microcarpa x Juglans regia]|uniref:monooxygenase 1-like n=1 Tax=Juglans microcarpa x Juglans regia TaxID=2249226 RepID=UPI001B7E5DE4|nr:monooxygenase 1-like [Juglans microcarpa x Juglans regia]